MYPVASHEGFLLVSVIHAVHGRTWCISQDGNQNASCVLDDPCLTLDDLDCVDLAPGDEVHLTPDGTVIENHCMKKHLKISVVIDGHGGTLSCNQTQNVLFAFIGSNSSQVVLKNLTFQTGFFLANRIDLEMVDCIFNDTSVLVGEEIVNVVLSSLSPDLFNEFGNGSVKEEGVTVPNALLIKNCTFYPVYSSFDHPNHNFLNKHFNKNLVPEGKSFMVLHGKNLKITIEGSVFYNHGLRISGSQVDLTLTMSSFIGNSNRKAVTGVVVYMSSASSHVEITDCWFEALYGDDHEVYTAPISLLQVTRALHFILEDKEVSINVERSEIHVTGSTFKHTSGAFLISGNAVNTHSVKIVNCSFVENYASASGAALVVNSSKALVSINDCLFLQNEAGSLKLPPGFERHNRIETIYQGVKVQFTCEMDECWAAYPGVPSSTVEAIGMGGTLFLLAGRVFMENCSLIDNSGSAGASDIFQNINTYLSLTNTNLSAHASKSKSGFINSAGTLLIDKVYITSLFAEGFVLVFQSDLEKMVIKNIQVVCAAYHQMKSDSKFSWGHYTGGLAFNWLVIQCERCHNRYSLSTGSFEIHQNSSNVTIMESASRDCRDCPQGANCSVSNIIAQPNYWGVADGDEVKMVRCQDTFCEPDPERQHFNTCAVNRKGRMCGECKPGYLPTLSGGCTNVNNCKNYILLPFVSIYYLTFITLLILRKDITTFLFGPESHKRFKKTVYNLFCPAGYGKNSEANSDLSNQQNAKHDCPETTTISPSDKDFRKNTVEGSTAFILILFYYFQDVSLLRVETEHKEVNMSGYYEDLQKAAKVIKGLFKFELDLGLFLGGQICLQSHSESCLFTIAFIGITYMILYVLWGIALKMEKTNSCKKAFWRGLKARLPSAYAIFHIYSIQKFTLGLGLLLRCIKIGDTFYLVIQAEHKCYTGLQFFMISLIIFFGLACLFLIFAPHVLLQQKMSSFLFCLGLTQPVPVTLYSIISQKCCRKKIIFPKGDKISEAAQAMYGILQGPYRECPFLLRFCWTGIFSSFRFLLAVLYIFVQEPIIKLSMMFHLITTALVLSIMVKPYKAWSSNTASFLSLVTLNLVCMINCTRAVYVSSGFPSRGFISDLLHYLSNIEDIFVLWLPLLGAGVFGLLIVICLLVEIINTCQGCTRRHAVQSVNY